MLLGDGRVGVTVEARDPAGNDSFSLRVIDKDKRDWGQSYPLPANSYVPVYDGSGDALFFYGSGDSLCLWREGAQEMEVLLKWMDTGINGDTLRLLAPLAGGRLAVMTRGKDPFSAGGGGAVHPLPRRCRLPAGEEGADLRHHAAARQ